MQFITYEAIQNTDFDHDESFGGSFISAWIKDQTTTNADFIARGWISANGWLVSNIDSMSVVCEDDYADDDSNKQFYKQALIDEEVFVYHTYPSD